MKSLLRDRELIRVLILEDVENDYELIKLTLRQAEFDCKYLSAKTKDFWLENVQWYFIPFPETEEYIKKLEELVKQYEEILKILDFKSMEGSKSDRLKKQLAQLKQAI